ncbi:hypothetical protein T11_11781, partial [Trichinella zimbabwensis]
LRIFKKFLKVIFHIFPVPAGVQGQPKRLRIFEKF